ALLPDLHPVRDGSEDAVRAVQRACHRDPQLRPTLLVLGKSVQLDIPKPRDTRFCTDERRKQADLVMSRVEVESADRVARDGDLHGNAPGPIGVEILEVQVPRPGVGLILLRHALLLTLPPRLLLLD